MSASFQSLTQEQKVDFFIKCQKLLLQYHPNSPFVVREDNLSKVLDACHNNIKRYQGYHYSDENVCVLWNHILVTDPKDVKKCVVENAYQPPNPAYNAVSIDFAVFRQMTDCLTFIKENNSPQIRYVLFIRDGNPKLYPIEVLLKGVHLKD